MKQLFKVNRCMSKLRYIWIKFVLVNQYILRYKNENLPWLQYAGIGECINAMHPSDIDYPWESKDIWDYCWNDMYANIWHYMVLCYCWFLGIWYLGKIYCKITRMVYLHCNTSTTHLIRFFSLVYKHISNVENDDVIFRHLVSRARLRMSFTILPILQLNLFLRCSAFLRFRYHVN